jgi:hypothetical protein
MRLQDRIRLFLWHLSTTDINTDESALLRLMPHCIGRMTIVTMI